MCMCVIACICVCVCVCVLRIGNQAHPTVSNGFQRNTSSALTAVRHMSQDHLYRNPKTDFSQNWYESLSHKFGYSNKCMHHKWLITMFQRWMNSFTFIMSQQQPCYRLYGSIIQDRVLLRISYDCATAISPNTNTCDTGWDELRYSHIIYTADLILKYQADMSFNYTEAFHQAILMLVLHIYTVYFWIIRTQMELLIAVTYKWYLRNIMASIFSYLIRLCNNISTVNMHGCFTRISCSREYFFEILQCVFYTNVATWYIYIYCVCVCELPCVFWLWKM